MTGPFYAARRARLNDLHAAGCLNAPLPGHPKIGDLLGPAACGPAEPITLRDKLACAWKQLLAARHKLASPLIFDP